LDVRETLRSAEQVWTFASSILGKTFDELVEESCLAGALARDERAVMSCKKDIGSSKPFHSSAM
jgi:hypothetical protein